MRSTVALKGLSLGLIIAGALAVSPAPASARTSTVACHDGLGDAEALVSAIHTANATPGPDTVALGDRSVYLFEESGNSWYGPNALPPIASDITIEGHGGTIARDRTAPSFRLFFVGADPASPSTDGYVTPGAGTLTLRDLTLANGYAQGGDSQPGGGGAGMGGAIFNQGRWSSSAARWCATSREAARPQTSRPERVAAGSAPTPSGTTAVASARRASAPVARAGTAASSPAAVARASGTVRTAPPVTSPASAGAAGRQPVWVARAGTSASITGAMAAVAVAAAPTTPAAQAAASVTAGCPSVAAASAAVVASGLAGAAREPAPAVHRGSGAALARPSLAAAAPAWAARSSTCRAASRSGTPRSRTTKRSAAPTTSPITPRASAGPCSTSAARSRPMGTPFAANRASSDGASIYNLVYDGHTARTAQATLRDTIIADGVDSVDLVSNKTAYISPPNLGTATVDVSRFNLVTSMATREQGAISGSPLTKEPLLGALRDNGGPTATMALGSGSPAIDAGAAFGLTTDQRGQPRPSDLSSVPNAADGSDIGAYEMQAPGGGSGRPGGPGLPGAPRQRPSFGAHTLIALRLKTTRIPVRGPLPVIVTNANRFAIWGRLSGTTADHARGTLRARPIRVRALSTATVKLTLPALARRRLARTGQLTIRLRATAQDPAGHARTVIKTVSARLGRGKPARR